MKRNDTIRVNYGFIFGITIWSLYYSASTTDTTQKNGKRNFLQTYSKQQGSKSRANLKELIHISINLRSSSEFSFIHSSRKRDSRDGREISLSISGGKNQNARVN